MKLLLILMSALSLSVTHAETCTYEVEGDAIEVHWTSYKTPLKAPVSGRFRDLGTSDKKGSSLKDLLENIPFKINTASVHTKNNGRDAKIIKFFFQPMIGGLMVSGKTLSYSKKVLKVSLKMNGVERVIPLKVSLDGENLSAKGTIDLLDFQMQKSLNGINQACYDLHEGKTWSDVAVELKMEIEKECK